MKTVPGSICSGIHSVRILSSATMITSRSCTTSAAEPRSTAIADNSRTSALPRAAGLRPRRTPAENLRMHFAHRIAQTDSKQRLARVLENVDHLFLRVFHIHALAVGQQMVVRIAADRLRQSPSKLLLQKLHDAAHFLQR